MARLWRQTAWTMEEIDRPLYICLHSPLSLLLQYNWKAPSREVYKSASARLYFEEWPHAWGAYRWLFIGCRQSSELTFHPYICFLILLHLDDHKESGLRLFFLGSVWGNGTVLCVHGHLLDTPKETYWEEFLFIGLNPSPQKWNNLLGMKESPTISTKCTR